MLSAFACGKVKWKLERGSDKKMGEGSKAVFVEILSYINMRVD